MAKCFQKVFFSYWHVSLSGMIRKLVFFAVLYFPWNICHAILKKRRGYNHGWLLGWFAIWMEGILLTTVPLSGMYVYTWLFNILTEKYSPADDISQRLLLVYVTSFQVQTFEEQFWGCAKVFKRLIWLSFNSSHCNHRCPHHSHPYHRFTAFSRFDFKSWQMNQNLNGIEIQRALNSR